MAADSRRPDPETPEEASGQESEDGAGDDLEALASTLGSLPPEAGDQGGEEDLDSLAAFAGGGRASVEGGDEDKLDLGRLMAQGGAQAPAAAPETPSLAHDDGDLEPAGVPKRSAWAMPLMVGLGIGVAVGAVMFGASATRSPADPAPAAAAATPEAPVVPKPLAEGPALALAPGAAAQPGAADPGAADEAAPAESAAPGEAPAPSEAPAAAAASPTGAPAARASGTAQPRAAAVPRPQQSPAAPTLPPAAPQPPSVPDEDRPPVLKLTPSAPPPDAPAPPIAKPDSEAASAKQARSMDNLLDEALSPEARRQELAARRERQSAKAELPLLPSRAQVTEAMTVLLPAIRGCAMGQSGLANATITVRSDGSVAATRITGAPFAGTASGRCMEGVLRRGKFPRFRQATFRVRYPLSIQ